MQRSARVVLGLILTLLLIDSWALASNIQPAYLDQPDFLQFTNNYANLTGHASAVTSLAFSPDDSLLASGSYDGTIRVWNAFNGDVIHVLRQPADGVVRLSFSPDGEILASSGWYDLQISNDSYETTMDSCVRLWDVASGSLLQTLRADNQRPWGLAFSPDGEMLAVGGRGGDDGFITLWSVTGGIELYNLTGHTDDVCYVAFSPDGMMLATGSWDNTVRLWDVASGSLLQTLTGNVEKLAFSPDGMMLATGSWDNTVRLWDVASGSLLQNLTGHTDIVISVAFSPDGTMLATGSWDNTVRLWDVASGSLLQNLTGHVNGVLSTVFSSDGTILATGGADWRIKLWGNHDPIFISADDDWPISSPEKQGMNSAVLNELFAKLDSTHGFVTIHGLVIARHGVIVAERYYGDGYHQYTQDDKHQLHSVTKSITSVLVGIAIDKGFIESVDQKVLDFFPDYNFSNVDSRKESMTLKHLLDMTSGLDWPELEIGYESPADLADQMVQCEDSVQFVLDKPMVEIPGTRFCYNSGAFHLLSTIVQRTTGYSTFDFAQKYLFDPLGIEPADVVWDTDYKGIVRGHSHLFLSPRSLAKIGQLYLNDGAWNGKQIISKEWIINSTRGGDVWAMYGYGWWIRDFGGYCARGLGGHYLYVLPEQDMVVVFTECTSAPTILKYSIIPAIGLITDLNNDGTVNIQDFAVISKAFGSVPGHLRWNPAADVNKDSMVNIIDMALIAKDFGQ